MSFVALNLSESLLRAVREAEYHTATPIQIEAIPGASGTAVTFCDHDERGMLRQIERLTRQRLNVAPHDFTKASESLPSADQAVHSAPHHLARAAARQVHPNHKSVGQSRQTASRQSSRKAAGRVKQFSRRTSTV